jgi:citrate synthase
MSELKWKTSITQVAANEVRLRGYRIDELMGSISFTEAIYLAITGDLPDPAKARLLDAIFVSSIDHGTSPPSALAARTSASTGAPMNAAVAAGLLSINRFHGGAIQDCMKIIQEGLRRLADEGEDTDQVARELVSEHKASGIRIAGLGHRLHTADPRTTRLFSLAEELDVAGAGVRMMRALQAAVGDSGRELPINVDGAIAAVLVDIGIPDELANAFFYISRVPGLVTQVYEEQTRERPMRRIDPAGVEYDGPSDRTLDRPS